MSIYSIYKKLLSLKGVRVRWKWKIRGVLWVFLSKCVDFELFPRNACDRLECPSIFVTFRDHQALPLYVLLYQADSNQLVFA